jgi:Xaa-Pro dipeptidase
MFPVPMIDRHALYLQRQDRLNQTMRGMGIGALLTPDPINILYATGSRNMTVWGLMGPSRFLLHFCAGPTILFEFSLGEHLSAGLPTITQIRSSSGITAKKTPHYRDNIKRFAAEVAHECALHLGADDPTLAVELVDFPFTDALRECGLRLVDATPLFQQARLIKQPLEIEAMRFAVARVQEAVAEVERRIAPGVTENEAWAEFHRGLIARDGEFVSTRLFQTGARTFPYFQESSNRVMSAGDLVCLDTDALGVMNYAVDFSRTFLCGDRSATPDQRRIYGIALEQLQHNAANLRAGTSFEAFARAAYQVPEKHRKYGYYQLAHGLGLAGEHPNLPRVADDGSFDFPGGFEENMVMCVESYVGDADMHQGVKLEDQYLVTRDGAERLSTYPFCAALLGA